MSSSPPPEVPVGATESTNKRRSGRVTRKPNLYTATSGTTKRKRDTADDRDDEDGADEEEDDDDDDSESEGEPAEEEMREKRARVRKGKTAAAKKSAPKRSKTNGTTVALPLRAGQGKNRRPKKAKALDETAAEEAGGLYAEVFAKGQTLDDVAAEWLKTFGQHESQAVADVVNFVLQCAGCHLEVTSHDIEDPDGCTNRIEDLQAEYQAQQEREKISDYPIIAKGKGTAAFRESIRGFFNTLVKTIHNSGTLLTNVELIENIQVWLSTMSAAQNRPFRHTATLISLSIVSALCEIGSELVEGSAKSLRHSESQRKKDKVNKGRVSGLQQEAKQAKQNQETLDTMLRDWFETIYIHRYRDVDPHIRIDCVKAMGDWIMTYPDVFFDGSHLRYLGWVLSDTNHSTRLEVVKQLLRFYRDTEKLGGLKTFTERFRARMVEMATRDADASVRAVAVELLDLLREGGFLEPDDIDAVGQLIFDAEPRVRKAVVGFFAESIKDAYDAKVDELGGLEALEETLGETDSDFDNPSLDWIKLKCLVEGLESYDAVDGDLPAHIQHGPGPDDFSLNAASAESRFMVATDTLYDHIAEVREWEAIAGYLLYDTSADQNGASNGDEAQLKEELRLGEKQEMILLEVLNSSVKGTIASLVDASSEKKARKTKKQREEVEDMQERAARHLANLIPRLLKKFGESPQTATTILRLERVVNLDAFQEFRQESSTYANLLDDINKQFMTHGDEQVLAEASRALLRAKSYHELGDTTDERIDTLWDDTINTFASLTRGKKLDKRGNLSSNVLDAIAKAVLRLEKLASISKPIEYLEAVPVAASAVRKSKAPELAPPLDSLIALINRAAPLSGTQQSSEAATLEDAVAMHASRTVCFYFMWRIPALINALETSPGSTDSELDALVTRRDAYINALEAVLKARPLSDDICVSVSGMLLDIHTIMVTLRRVPTNDKTGEDFLALATDMNKWVQRRILRIFDAVETAFAKASGRHLDTVIEDTQDGQDEDELPDDPIDQDPEDDEAESLTDDEEDGLQESGTSQQRRSNKLQKSLMAEQRLCEISAKLVLAVLGGMVDRNVVRTRLERNKAKLGKNFQEVLNHLELANGKPRAGKANKKVKGVAQPKQAAKSKEEVDDEESDEEEEEERQEEAERENHAEDDDEDEDVIREREIAEDEEMADRDAAAAEEEEPTAEEAESVLGD
ncbi:hypothetical protein MBLNU459_g3200t1 [Dothideomycetes sp. NU459]